MKKLSVLPMLVGLVLAPAAHAATDNQVNQSNSADGTPNLHTTEGTPLHARVAVATKPRREDLPAPKAVAVPPALQAIASCESGGDPKAVGGGGLYRGKYQFSIQTWQATGGQGDPVNAPEAVQDRLAIKLYNSTGAGQWPVCGQ